MIEIIRYESKWRIVIFNETLEFEDTKSFEDILLKLTKIKEKFEPYNNTKKDGKKREK